MNTLDYLSAYYQNYDEDGRLTGSRKYDASGSPVGNE